MNELEEKIYQFYQSQKQYFFSNDASIQLLEEKSIKNLEANGYIRIKMNTIGYVIAEII